MQDRDLVASVVAGEPDGLAEAYDRYAASLYAYCCSMLPRAEAAEAVRDTFLIAVSRLDGPVILTGSMRGCTPWRGTSACAAWAPENPERPQRWPAQWIQMTCLRSRFRPNSAARC